MTLERPDLRTRGRCFLRRLRRDAAGNVFAMTAAAVVPMIGVVGGAVDASRLYLTKTRLQSACDSAVLAGRKAMSTTVYTSAAQARANSMFAFNFQDADYGTTGTGFTSSADSNGKVSGTVTTTVPMTLMKIFGYQSSDLTVSCSADIQIPNIDIVFVLDVTGSMGETINGTAKIDAMKTAAKNFYTTLDNQLKASGANAGQIRYGFVPYSQAVNVRELFKSTPDSAKGELPLTALVNTMVGESRVANFEATGGGGANAYIEDTATAPKTYDQVYDASAFETIEPYSDHTIGGTVMSNYDCDLYSENKSFQIDDTTARKVYLYPYTSWPGGQDVGYSTLYIPEGSTTAQSAKPTSGTYYWQITFERQSGRWEDNNGRKTGKYRTCERRVTHTRYIKNVPQFKFKNWTYKPVTYDVSSFKSGSTLTYASAVSSAFVAPDAGPYDPVQLAQMPVKTGLTLRTMSWRGCIEERDTVAATTFTPIPTDAHDLDFLTGDTNDAYRWRPSLYELTYNRGQPGWVTSTSTIWSANFSCPSVSARNLNPMTQTAFNTYIDTLQPAGYTYLDAGLVWGMRLIAPQGMFGSRNLTGPNGGQISRHIIFLTDGEPVSADNSYSSYGLERVSRRITGSTGQPAATLHARRFQALCDAQRGTVSIWAIAFGTSVTGNLQNCADPGRAFQANNSTELDNAFRNIAQQVADLRLVS